MWKLPDLTPGVVLKGHNRGIWPLEFSPVDQFVITGSGDKTIKIWAISDGSCLKTFEGQTSSVFKVQFLTRGAQFVSCGADGLLKLWTVKTNACVVTCDQLEDKVSSKHVEWKETSASCYIGYQLVVATFRAGLLPPPPMVAMGRKGGPRDTRPVDPLTGHVMICLNNLLKLVTNVWMNHE